MAKAKAIKELDCTADAREWAEKVLRVRIAEVVALKGEALDFTDIEGVHDMRVAARRLRSALRDFGPLTDKSRLKKVSKELKDLADALGDVRDQDVAITALDALQIESPRDSIKTGLGLLSAERQSDRDSARRRLVKTLDSKGFEKLHHRFSEALAKAFDKNSNQDSVSFNQAGRKAVAAALDDFLGLSASLYYPSKNADLHRLRISAKRLRYALELFVACWGDKIAPYADEIAKMQSHLGEIHDCDIWIEDLGDRLEHGADKSAGNADERSASSWLLSEFASKRSSEYLSALGLWTNWEQDSFVTKMRTAISTSA
jgi:CHAD domain-containing protein